MGSFTSPSWHRTATHALTNYSSVIDIEHVYRVTVRGRFRELDERARAFLDSHRADHDIFKSAFTPEGTFVYDDALKFFSLRYEIRTAQGVGMATEAGLEEATRFLSTMGFPHHDLKVSAMDTSTMWSE